MKAIDHIGLEQGVDRDAWLNPVDALTNRGHRPAKITLEPEQTVLDSGKGDQAASCRGRGDESLEKGLVDQADQRAVRRVLGSIEESPGNRPMESSVLLR